jgi:hypothetical protein
MHGVTETARPDRAILMPLSHCARRPRAWRGMSSVTGGCRSSMRPLSPTCCGVPVVPKLLAGLIEGMRLRPASDYELLHAVETQPWILGGLGDLPPATALARRALPVMRRMPRFALIGYAHLLMRLGRFEEAARVPGAQTARTRAGLAPPMPPGMSVLERLQGEAFASIQDELAPSELAGVVC